METFKQVILMENIILSFQDVTVTRSGNELILANSRIRRVLDLACGAPRTVSLTDAQGKEYADATKTSPDLAFIAMYPAGMNEAIPWHITDISAEAVPASFRDSAHVKVSISMREEVSETEYLREYLLYPDFPAVSVRNAIRPKVLPMRYWTARGKLDQEPGRPDVPESTADAIRTAEGFHPVKTVSFAGRTDYHDELMTEHKADGEFLNGNLLFCENTSGAGFLFLQEAPPSGERRDMESYDFRIRDGEILSCSWGIHPSEIRPDRTFHGYRHDLILYHTPLERDFLLKAFLKKRFPARPASVMVNPWGCGQFPQLVSEAFLIEEMKAAPEVGATHYQIDDAWQEGGSLSELGVKNRHITERFWQISQERLNGTFAPIMKAAKEAEIEPGLWMAPSCNCEYADWRAFADRILELHKEYGFRAFKIDSVMIRTAEAEENLRSLLDSVREKTDGTVYFNLDTTNGQRPGYFLFLEYGNIFLENRYVCHMWGVGYHPEKTLRSLWRLAKYMRTQELQIEVPYAGDINEAFYADKPWVPPRTYSQEYWAAIAMFANPLLWFAPSRVRPEDRPAIRNVMEIHKKYRDGIFAGEIYPVGEEPSGKAFTGLLSRNDETGKAYLILYREAGAVEENAEIALPGTRTEQWNLITGNGNIVRSSAGKITVAMPRASYLMLESV